METNNTLESIVRLYKKFIADKNESAAMAIEKEFPQIIPQNVKIVRAIKAALNIVTDNDYPYTIVPKKSCLEWLDKKLTESETDESHWNPKDVRPGDVVCCKHFVFIYRGTTDDGRVSSFFDVCLDEKNEVGYGECKYITDIDCIKPATKEERKLLFDKLKSSIEEE
jgi:hypothetical protein